MGLTHHLLCFATLTIRTNAALIGAYKDPQEAAAKVLSDPEFQLNRSRVQFGVSYPDSFRELCLLTKPFYEETGIEVDLNWLHMSVPSFNSFAKEFYANKTCNGRYWDHHEAGVSEVGSDWWNLWHTWENLHGGLGGHDIWLQTTPRFWMFDYITGKRLTPTPDIFEDLTPYVRNSQHLSKETYRRMTEPRVMREVMMRSDTVDVWGLPMPIHVNMVILQAVDNDVWDIPNLLTWEELVTNLERISLLDRNKDDVPDGVFCTEGWLASCLWHSILASYFRLKHDTTEYWFFDTSTLHSYAGTEAMIRASTIFSRLMALTYEKGPSQSGDVVTHKCIIELTPVAIARFSDRWPLNVGTDEVFDKSTAQLKACTPSLCPWAVEQPQTGRLINLAPSGVTDGLLMSISKTSIHKGAAWRFIEYVYNHLSKKSNYEALMTASRSGNISWISRKLGRENDFITTRMSWLVGASINWTGMDEDSAVARLVEVGTQYKTNKLSKFNQTELNHTLFQLRKDHDDSVDRDSHKRPAYLMDFFRLQGGRYISFDEDTFPQKAASTKPILCSPGFFRPAPMAKFCEPCPKGFFGSMYTSENNTCEQCPLGKYNSEIGQYNCIPCETEFLTKTVGATESEACKIPLLNLNPDFPEKTYTDLFWSITGLTGVDEDTKSASIQIEAVFGWVDDRVTTDSASVLFGSTSLTLERWKDNGFWFPDFRLENSMSVTIESDIVEFNIKSLGYGMTETTCYRKVEMEAEVSWHTLDFVMFPFGKQTLQVELTCLPPSLCECSACQYPRRLHCIGEVCENEDRRLTVRSRANNQQAVVHQASNNTDAVSVEAGQQWLAAWPLVSKSREGVLGSSQSIVLKMERPALLFSLRICMPSAIMTALTVLVFFLQDTYEQLAVSFTSLLVVAVLAEQIKDSMPSHVIYMTWMDYFFLANFAALSMVTIVSILVIYFEEHRSTNVQRMSGILDKSASVSSPAFVIAMNSYMLIVAKVQEDLTGVPTTLSLLAASFAVFQVLSGWYLYKFEKADGAKERESQESDCVSANADKDVGKYGRFEDEQHSIPRDPITSEHEDGFGADGAKERESQESACVSAIADKDVANDGRFENEQYIFAREPSTSEHEDEHDGQLYAI